MATQAFRAEPDYLTAKKVPSGAQAARRNLAVAIVGIVKEHVAHGIQRVTSRQLYYRLVAANAVPNTEKSYKMVTALLADMRYWGRIDWDFIVDLGREPIIPGEFRDINALAEAAVHSLRYDRWAGQPYYVEVWVEKQALQSVLEPIGDELHVPVVVNKGYSSASAMFQAARRLRAKSRDADGAKRKPVVLYFGDRDPSGEDMVRDVTDRLHEFGVTPEIHKIALTLPQVEEFSCPVNPAKSTDSRYKGYMELLEGDETYLRILEAQDLGTHDADGSLIGYSWELDSLPVEVLSQRVRSAVEEYIDNQDLVEAVKEREENDKRALRAAADAIARGDFDADSEVA